MLPLVATALAGAPEGRELFVHAWTAGDPLAGGGNGLGPLFNDTSCAGCHAQGGVGGAGGPDANVTLLPDGVVPARSVAPGWDAVRRARLEPPATHPAFECGLAARQFFLRFEETGRQTPALFGAAALGAVPEEALLAAVTAGEAAGVSGRIARNAEGRPGRFGWKGQLPTLAAFVDRACAFELGLTTPSTAELPDPRAPRGDPPAPDLTAAQVADLVAFVESLPPPRAGAGRDRMPGRARFVETGCAACHAERLGTLEGAYTDLLLHALGLDLADPGRGYGAAPDAVAAAAAEEWRTPPLWGVSASAPYLHDGRAATLDEAIAAHAGEADAAREAYAALSAADRAALLEFLAAL